MTSESPWDQCTEYLAIPSSKANKPEACTAWPLAPKSEVNFADLAFAMACWAAAANCAASVSGGGSVGVGADSGAAAGRPVQGVGPSMRGAGTGPDVRGRG